MKDIYSLLQSLRRPRLLIRAARIAAEDYRRPRHLGRILGQTPAERSGPALLHLIEIEAELDAHRRAHLGGYSVARHVEVLAAMIAEARLLRAG